MAPVVPAKCSLHLRVFPTQYKYSSYSPIMGGKLCFWGSRHSFRQWTNIIPVCEPSWFHVLCQRTLVQIGQVMEQSLKDRNCMLCFPVHQRPCPLAGKNLLMLSPKSSDWWTIENEQGDFPQVTGEVTFLQIVFPFRAHTLHVQAGYELNRTCSKAELAPPREHSYTNLNVAWRDVFCICFGNCLYLVLLPLFDGIDSLCSEMIQNQNSGNACSETEQHAWMPAAHPGLWLLPRNVLTWDYKSEPDILHYTTPDSVPESLHPPHNQCSANSH